MSAKGDHSREFNMEDSSFAAWAQPWPTEEPFDIRIAARVGYPLPKLAGGAPDEGGDAGADGDGGADGAKADGLHGLYDLSSTPEELRPYAEELLGQVSRNVDEKFREHADYRKGWAPFEELGLRDMDPEFASNLIRFGNEILSDPEALKAWMQAVSEEIGFAPQMDQESWIAFGEQNGFFDDGGEGTESSQPDVLAQLTQLLDERLGPMESVLQQQRQDAEIETIKQQVEQQLDALASEHGDFDRAAVVRLAQSFANAESEDPIADAFAEYQRLTGTAQSDLLDSKTDAPGQALQGGAVDTSPEKFDGLDDPKLKEAVRARLASAR